MQSMQRQFGKLLSKGPGDNAKVSVILNDYEDADKVLARVRVPPCCPRAKGVADFGRSSMAPNRAETPGSAFSTASWA